MSSTALFGAFGQRVRAGSRTAPATGVVGDAAFRDAVAARLRARGTEVVHGTAPGLPLVVQASALASLVGDAGEPLLGAPSVRVLDRADDPLGHPIALPGRILKRLLDVAVATAALLVTAPVLAVAAMAIKLDSPGPVLFRQERVGRDGRRFPILKLRTMRTGGDLDDDAHLAYVAAMMRGEAERNGGIYKLVGDPRVTRVGRFLRTWSVDELPQLWNVLLGHMSLVGPRPPMPSEVALYDAAAWQRLRVEPGITGLWQVSGRNETTFAEMVELDTRYWRSWSPLLELSILLRTPLAVIASRRTA